MLLNIVTHIKQDGWKAIESIIWLSICKDIHQSIDYLQFQFSSPRHLEKQYFIPIALSQPQSGWSKRFRGKFTVNYFECIPVHLCEDFNPKNRHLKQWILEDIMRQTFQTRIWSTESNSVSVRYMCGDIPSMGLVFLSAWSIFWGKPSHSVSLAIAELQHFRQKYLVLNLQVMIWISQKPSVSLF